MTVSRYGFPLIISLLLSTASATAQTADLKAPRKMSRWDVPAANYSGITRIADGQFAVIDDKSPDAGFYMLGVAIDRKSGKIKEVSRSPLFCDSLTAGSQADAKADIEDIAYIASSQTFYLVSEAHQTIEEYDAQGRKTGRALHVPDIFASSVIVHNGGFESLAYDSLRHSLWTTTECPLPLDGGDSVDILRLQSFDVLTGEPNGTWLYAMDSRRYKSARFNARGVSAITVCPDGSLLVLERELRVPRHYAGSKCTVRIYRVTPNEGNSLSPTCFGSSTEGCTPLEKTPVASFTTRLGIFGGRYANYEGMCFGPTLSDGSRTLILIADSQQGAGNFLYRLRDYLRVIRLKK